MSVQGMSILGKHVSSTQHMYDVDIAFKLLGGAEGLQPFSVGLILLMGADTGEVAVVMTGLCSGVQSASCLHYHGFPPEHNIS